MSTIPEVTDLALNSFGFFSAPDQVYPPENNSCFYEVNHNLNVSQAEVNNFLFKIRTDIGKERDKTFTSLQERKVFNLSLTTLSGLGAFTCASTVLGTATIGMLVLSAACFYGLIQFCLAFREYDLDNPVVRNGVLDVIGDWSFRKILDNFSIDKIARYDLFETKLLSLTDEMRCSFYANLANLYLDKFDLDIAKDADLLEVTRCYSEGTRHITRWINGCRANRANIEWGRYERDQANPCNEDEALRKINRLMELKIEGKYRDLITPWDGWKSREVSNINGAFKNALDGFESVYNRVLNGKGGFYSSAETVNVFIEARV
ncbi:hypothetical protein COB11_00750 [Candidatus Aerophobetes bacterium]|uniref:Uncharacterized protein n=1 Tax=Aerophobetes bacterium TaxID=2030807 RepID=A0A2A4YMW6_UNCAE|nr:MAG: hypothetical protein COB11_00750 [Candidatus Aerophobetes bacterium]